MLEDAIFLCIMFKTLSVNRAQASLFGHLCLSSPKKAIAREANPKEFEFTMIRLFIFVCIDDSNKKKKKKKMLVTSVELF